MKRHVSIARMRKQLAGPTRSPVHVALPISGIPCQPSMYFAALSTPDYMRAIESVSSAPFALLWRYFGNTEWQGGIGSVVMTLVLKAGLRRSRHAPRRFVLGWLPRWVSSLNSRHVRMWLMTCFLDQLLRLGLADSQRGMPMLRQFVDVYVLENRLRYICCTSLMCTASHHCLYICPLNMCNIAFPSTCYGSSTFMLLIKMSTAAASLATCQVADITK